MDPGKRRKQRNPARKIPTAASGMPNSGGRKRNLGEIFSNLQGNGLPATITDKSVTRQECPDSLSVCESAIIIPPYVWESAGGKTGTHAGDKPAFTGRILPRHAHTRLVIQQPFCKVKEIQYLSNIIVGFEPLTPGHAVHLSCRSRPDSGEQTSSRQEDDPNWPRGKKQVDTHEMSFVRGTRPGYRPGAQAARPASRARKVPPVDPLPSESVCNVPATKLPVGIASLTGFRAGCDGLNRSQALSGSCRPAGYQRG
ncbi:hypothetical protein Bbelb_423290 [Branchiostoma belcheri]|nr:hypothetical protein Bbelb_423290 [Branchiostoma belcheri]